MKHLFDVEMAAQMGINASILFENISYWVAKNEANGEHFHDGLYWTYNSVKAFATMFPYMSKKQIEGALKKLVDEGLIVIGNYNTKPFDHTSWYAVTQKGKSIGQKGEIDCSKMGNRFPPEGKPIPNINTDINTDKDNAPLTPQGEAGAEPVEEKKPETKKTVRERLMGMIDSYTDDADLREALNGWVLMRLGMKGRPLTDRALELSLKKLDKLASSVSGRVDVVNQSVERGWVGLFAVDRPAGGQSAPPQRTSSDRFIQQDYTPEQLNSVFREL